MLYRSIHTRQKAFLDSCVDRIRLQGVLKDSVSNNGVKEISKAAGEANWPPIFDALRIATFMYRSGYSSFPRKWADTELKDIIKNLCDIGVDA